MSAPPFLAGAALVLWGFALGTPLFGVALAIAMEAARWIPGAQRLARPGARVAAVRMALALVVITLGYAAATSRFPEALYLWLKTLPLALAPLFIAQVAGREGYPLAAVWDALRKGTGRYAGERRIDFTYAYVAAVLLSAGTGNKLEALFYGAACVIVTWSLVARVPRRHWIAATILVALAVGIGYGVHRGLFVLQGELEEMDLDALRDFFSPNPDPLRERTRIGDVGKVKLKDRIVMRVIADDRKPYGVLLRESAFDQYSGGEWKASRRTFRPIGGRDGHWLVREGKAPRSLVVRRSLPGGEGVLALPAGTRTIDELPAGTLETLESGAVRAKGTPRFLSMRIAYDEGGEAGTVAADTEVPALLAGLLDRVIVAEGLENRGSPERTLAAVENLFASKYRYSLGTPEGRNVRGRTLAEFLTTDHKGHCEYFATATTLLLRRLGIPARYTVGYAAQEWSELEKAFVVRHRHAHAWTSAFIGGRWVTVDTTPAIWAEAEAEEARGPFAAFLDLFSYATDRIVQAWIESSPSDIARAGGVVLLVVLLPFALRTLLRRLRRMPAPARAVSQDRAALAWRRVEKALARRGFPRAATETPREFALRVARTAQPPPWSGELASLVEEYYRACFDPQALQAAERFPATARDFLQGIAAPPRLAPARV
jgi:hypothetical protein